VVSGIFGMADECGSERDARGRRQTLQHGGQGKTNERRRIFRREPIKLGEHGGRGWGGVGPERTLTQHRVERPRVAEESDGPRANVFVGIAQAGAEPRLIRRADPVERPERAELEDGLRGGGIAGEQRPKLRGDDRRTGGAGRELLASLAHPPLVGVRVQRDEVREARLGEIDRGRGRWWAVGDFVDATTQAIHAGGVVAFAGVAPIENKPAPVRSVGNLLAAKPRVAGNEKIWAVTGDVTGALALENLGVGAAAVEVERVKLIAKCGGPVVAEVDHHAHMGVPTAVGVGGPVAGFFPMLVRVEVPMVSVQIDEPVSIRIRVERMGAHVVLAGCVVPEVAVDGVDEK
jgi:hypothetical protein